MAKFFLTGADRQTLQNTINIVNGGSGNNRPIARRRRQVVSEGVAEGTWLLGLTVAAVSPNSGDFEVDQLTAFRGSIPTEEVNGEEQPVDSVSVENVFGWTLDADAVVLIARGKSSTGEGTRWICVQAECPA
jgi:hypothetical protein